MNILLITYQGSLTGSTNSIAFLAKGLADRGHTSVVGLRKDSLLDKLLEGSSVVREYMEFKGRLDFNNIEQIRVVVEKYNIQIINAQSSLDRYTTIFSKWKNRLNVKIYHTRRQPPKSIGGLQNYFYRWGTDKFIVISHELKRIFIEKGFPENHLHVIHNGIPAERYNQWSEGRVAELRHKFQLDPSQFIIGCVSRMKKQDQLIEAVKVLNDPEAVLIFAGAEEDRLKPHLDRFKLTNRVIFAGKVPPEDILNYYRLFDVQVLPSITDGFGLVLLEAMAMQCPVIATDFGGIKDVVRDGVNGLLFENENINQLVDHLKKIRNPDLREVLIKNGVKTAYEEFSIEKTVDGYEQFFKSELGITD